MVLFGDRIRHEAKLSLEEVKQWLCDESQNALSLFLHLKPLVLQDLTILLHCLPSVDTSVCRPAVVFHNCF
jgi:peroxiredoxin